MRFHGQQKEQKLTLQPLRASHSVLLSTARSSELRTRDPSLKRLTLGLLNEIAKINLDLASIASPIKIQRPGRALGAGTFGLSFRNTFG